MNNYFYEGYMSGEFAEPRKCYLCENTYIGFKCQESRHHICEDCHWFWETLLVGFLAIAAYQED